LKKKTKSLELGSV